MERYTSPSGAITRAILTPASTSIRPQARRRSVTKGAPFPSGLDLDKDGNVYVVNSSSTESSSGLSKDTTHLLTEFAPHAAKVLRQVSKGFTDGQFLTVDDNGTAYIEEYPRRRLPDRGRRGRRARPRRLAKMLTKAVHGAGYRPLQRQAREVGRRSPERRLRRRANGATARPLARRERCSRFSKRPASSPRAFFFCYEPALTGLPG